MTIESKKYCTCENTLEILYNYETKNKHDIKMSKLFIKKMSVRVDKAFQKQQDTSIRMIVEQS